jgi:hypothetical protein
VREEVERRNVKGGQVVKKQSRAGQDGRRTTRPAAGKVGEFSNDAGGRRDGGVTLATGGFGGPLSGARPATALLDLT